MSTGVEGSLTGKAFLWVDADQRGLDIWAFPIREAGGEVVPAYEPDTAISLVQRREFSAIFYEIRLPTGHVFRDHPAAKEGQTTGALFADWVRSCDGGGVSEKDVPLILLTDVPEEFLDRWMVRPRGPRDRTLQKIVVMPDALLAIVHEILRI